MSFIRYKKVEFLDRLNRPKQSTYIVASCEQCLDSFERKIRTRYNTEEKCKKTMFFCSKKCHNLAKKKDGVLYKKRQRSVLEKYGTENVFQSTVIKEKCKKTLMKNYGVEYPLQSETIITKARQTWTEKYSVDNPMKNTAIRKKQQDTLKKRYGVITPLKSKEIQQKVRETCLKRYGVEYPSQSKEIQQKTKETNLEKYNVPSTLQLDKARVACNNRRSHIKRHETMKKNMTYGKSKPEDRFYSFLCARFANKDVERQVRVNEWNIDFRVGNTFIQFDGIYWHGLDRDISIVKESENIRDKAIFKTYKRDCAQNKWFKENNLKLVRITDAQFLEKTHREIANLLDINNG